MTVCDGLAEGFRFIAVKEAPGDRVPGAMAWNLFDIDAKSADAESTESCAAHLNSVKRRNKDNDMFPKTFSPLKLGPLTLKNRLIMAPLTRQVADADGTPTAEMAAYYARRARGGLGLIISEGTYEIDELGCKAYLSQPGIANDKHVAGWKLTTDAVHALDVPIICQLMHGGRVSDPRCLFAGESAVSASDTQSEGLSLIHI